MKNRYPIKDKNLNHESSPFGILFYFSRPRNNFCIHKSTGLELIFIEVLNTKKTNVFVGYIYCHPQMDSNKLNDCYPNNLLDKLSKEN